MSNKILFWLGTRGSPLALWQAERVQSLLREKRPDVTIELVPIQTTGDKILDKPLVQVGGKGVFTKEIELALLKRKVDFAVHSFKDLPTQLPEGLAIICIPERDSPFDALFSRRGLSLKSLPKNPLVATGSLRRRAQVLAVRPDAQVIDVRGNVNTRLRKYRESDWDGLIMAMAGIRRMGWEEQIAGILSTEEMLPAPAQGALAVEARADDADTRELLLEIHDETTAAGVRAERAFLSTLEGGCQVPIGAYAMRQEETITLEGLIATLDGALVIRERISGPVHESASLGIRLAETVLAKGGSEIIEQLKSGK